MKGREAYCDFCAMEVEYDSHGNCTQCGRHIHDVSFREAKIIDASRYAVDGRRLKEYEVRERLAAARSSLFAVRKANRRLRNEVHVLSARLKKAVAFIGQISRVVKGGSEEWLPHRKESASAGSEKV